MRRLIVLAVAALAMAITFTIHVEDVDARPTHSAITAPSLSVCNWVGVRDGVLGIGDTTLIEHYNFVYIDHTWVYCKVRIALSTSIRCHAYIVSRHDGYTIHLGDTSCR